MFFDFVEKEVGSQGLLDPNSLGIMTRSDLCCATPAKDLDLPPKLVVAECCRCWCYLSCQDPHLSEAMTRRTWIYIPHRNPHLSRVMMRINLFCATFAKDSALAYFGSIVFCWDAKDLDLPPVSGSRCLKGYDVQQSL